MRQDKDILSTVAILFCLFTGCKSEKTIVGMYSHNGFGPDNISMELSPDSTFIYKDQSDILGAIIINGKWFFERNTLLLKKFEETQMPLVELEETIDSFSKTVSVIVLDGRDKTTIAGVGVFVDDMTEPKLTNVKGEANFDREKVSSIRIDYASIKEMKLVREGGANKLVCTLNFQNVLTSTEIHERWLLKRDKLVSTNGKLILYRKSP